MITPMAQAWRRKLWVDWCVSSWRPWSGFKRTFSCIVQYSLYLNMDIGTMWHCALFCSTRSQSIGPFFGCALFWYRVSLGAPVISAFVKFYFIMIIIMIVVTITEIFMANNYFLNYTLGFIYLSSSGSANAQLPGWFRLWTFSLNIGMDMLPSDGFISC